MNEFPQLELAAPAMVRTAAAAWMAMTFMPMPGLMRAVLALASGCIALPLAAGIAAPATAWWQWGPLEAMAGACIGGVAALSVEALRLAGRVASEQMGVSLGEHADPAGEADGGPVQAMMGWAAVIAFVSVGGVDAVVLAASRAGPAEAWLGSSRQLGAALDASFEVGLRACLPVLAVTLAGTVVGGAVIRASPRLVTLGGGFGVRAATGLGMLAASMATSWVVQQDLVRRSLAWLDQGGGG